MHIAKKKKKKKKKEEKETKYDCASVREFASRLKISAIPFTFVNLLYYTIHNIDIFHARLEGKRRGKRREKSKNLNRFMSIMSRFLNKFRGGTKEIFEWSLGCTCKSQGLQKYNSDIYIIYIYIYKYLLRIHIIYLRVNK